jgi:2-oxoglutarate ferredoxin oxidoreductase subunit beta
MLSEKDYNTRVTPTWCAGCGAFSTWSSIKNALVNLKKHPHEVVLTYDIGCSGNMADKLNSYGYKTLHGRSIAIAGGIKIANPDLTVIATGGDGGLLEEGVNHLLWAARSNYDITAMVNNNQRFSLTTGQPTVTTVKGEPGKTAPEGIVEQSINPAHMVLIAGASFVARSFSGDPAQLTQILEAAVKHPGFAYVEVFQPCVTFNDKNTVQWFRDKIKKLEEVDHNPNSRKQAMEKASLDGENIYTGIIYQDENSVPYSQALPYRKDVTTTPVEEVRKYDGNRFLEEFK